MTHTQTCLKENSNNVQYLNNHINALLLANRLPEAIPYLQKLIKFVPLATTYYQLGSLYEQTIDLLNANKAYEQGLALGQGASDSEMTYHILSRVRNNYLELEDIAHALPFAKRIYQSPHAKPTELLVWYIMLTAERSG